jgi:hypothetical protein
MPIDIEKIKAIDVHVHAEVSCHDPEDPVMGKFFDAASAYLKAPRERPKMPEIAGHLPRAADRLLHLHRGLRERHRGEAHLELRGGRIRREDDDICMAFASIDPHKGKMGAREARDLIENYGVKGFEFHRITQNIEPAARVGYPIYEVIAEYCLPAIFHTGHSGIGHRHARRCGVRLEYGQPMLVETMSPPIFPT